MSLLPQPSTSKSRCPPRVPTLLVICMAVRRDSVSAQRQSKMLLLQPQPYLESRSRSASVHLEAAEMLSLSEEQFQPVSLMQTQQSELPYQPEEALKQEAQSKPQPQPQPQLEQALLLPRSRTQPESPPKFQPPKSQAKSWLKTKLRASVLVAPPELLSPPELLPQPPEDTIVNTDENVNEQLAVSASRTSTLGTLTLALERSAFASMVALVVTPVLVATAALLCTQLARSSARLGSQAKRAKRAGTCEADAHQNAPSPHEPMYRHHGSDGCPACANGYVRGAARA